MSGCPGRRPAARTDLFGKQSRSSTALSEQPLESCLTKAERKAGRRKARERRHSSPTAPLLRTLLHKHFVRLQKVFRGGGFKPISAKMQLLQSRSLCTLVAATTTRHRHGHVPQSPKLVHRALSHSRLPRVQTRVIFSLLRSVRGGPAKVLLLQEQRRFLVSLRGGEGRPQEQETRQVCLELSGLSCGSCVAKAERALLSVDGVLEASVNLTTSQARVVTEAHGRAKPASTELVRGVEAAGFQAKELWDTASAYIRVVLDVQGLKCGGCVSKGEAALKGVKGVQEATINLATSAATVTLAGPSGATGKLIASPTDLISALAERGYASEVVRVSLGREGLDQDKLDSRERVVVTPAQRYEREATESRQCVRTSLLLLAASAAAHLGHHAHQLLPPGTMAHVPLLSVTLLPAGWFKWVQAGLATAALLGPGASLLRSGLASLRRLSPDMNSLVATGVLGVYSSSLLALLNPSLGLSATFHEPEDSYQSANALLLSGSKDLGLSWAVSEIHRVLPFVDNRSLASAPKVMLLGAVLLGRSLEARQRLKAARGLQALFDIRPDQARLVDGKGGVQEVPAARLRVGDTVEVLPGDRFPVDGVVLEGRTAADESSLTGEPVPIPQGPGDSVRAGTLSTGDGGPVRVRATATGAGSTLASVTALVEDAQARKVPIQRLADTIAGRFTWLVLAASASTLVFWGALSPSLLKFAGPAGAAAATYPAVAEALGGGSPWALGARLAVDVCLVACPCSLGLATPTAVMVGTGVAAERGLLLKGVDVLETAKKITTVIFDKTGTLTTGKPVIAGVISLDPEWDKSRILQAAAAVEVGCRHPLAEAVVTAAEREVFASGSSPLHAEGLRTVPGLGASAQVRLRAGDANNEMNDVHVGSPRYIREACSQDPAYGEGIDPVVRRLLSSDRSVDVGMAEGGDRVPSALSDEVEQHLWEGKSAIMVAVDNRVVGLLFAADTVRPAASAAVRALAQRGLKVRVASGDRKEAVIAAAAGAGVPVEAISWAASPADKCALVRSLQAEGEVVMLVGDGVNDSPALAAADVGVALRGGTGSAMDVADVVLMRDDVRGVGQVVDVSKFTMRKVHQNLIWALGYNVVAMPLAAGALLPAWGVALSPASAGAIMSCSSVAVVTNSLLLRKALERELK